MRVIIVEDEALLAVQLEDEHDSGHSVVGVAMSAQQALRLAKAERPDLALVDVHLFDGPTGVDVAQRIAANRHTVVIFMTPNVKRLPEGLGPILA